MYDALQWVSALLILLVVWVINSLDKLHLLVNYALRGDSGMGADLSGGVLSLDKMPGPKGWPILGDVLSYLRNSDFKAMMTELQDLFDKYGSVFKRKLGGFTVVYVKDPKDVEVVFKADGKYPTRTPFGSMEVDRKYRRSRNLPQSMAVL